MKTLCKIRDIQRSIAEYEARLQKDYGLCLNEGMMLCTLAPDCELTSGQLAESLGLSLSNTSKVICALEDRGFIVRITGKADRRKMYFSLTSEGRKKLQEVNCRNMELPSMLAPLFPECL